MGEEEELQYRTISGYRAALRNWFAVASQCTGSNPVGEEVVDRVLSGIKRECIARKVEMRGARTITISLTPQLLMQLEPILLPPVSSAADRMIWAACCVGVFGLLRPNEFMGTYKLEHRALRPQQLTFYDAAKQLLCPFTQPRGNPARLEIRLGVTKADPEAKNPPVQIIFSGAVKAIWSWMVERANSGEKRPWLWACPFEKQLTITSLLSAIRKALMRAGIEAPLVTGRCFRRGGALGMVMAGATLEEIMQQGRWGTPLMVPLYAGQHPKPAGKSSGSS